MTWNTPSYGLLDLSAGTKSALLRFEKSVRERSDNEQEYIDAKRALVRRLRRLEKTLPVDTRGNKRGNNGRSATDTSQRRRVQLVRASACDSTEQQGEAITHALRHLSRRRDEADVAEADGQ
jgi:hypothetical protein